MFRSFVKITFCIIFATLFSIQGCMKAPPPPNYGNEWKPVNSFTEKIIPIQMYRPYEYKVLNIDVTLKALLNRWAKDALIDAEYNFCFDYSLPKEIERVNSRDLKTAIEQLNSIYEHYPIKVFLYDRKISVEYDVAKDTENALGKCG